MNHKVILISKRINYTFPFGFAYLAGHLKANGYDVEVLFMPESPAFYADFAQRIIKKDPLLVGIGSIYPDLYFTRDFIPHLDAAKRSFPVVIGGQMVTPIPEFALDITGADVAVIGEGERILVDILDAVLGRKEMSQVQGIVFKKNGAFVHTGPGECFEDIDRLPNIPYELFPTENWLRIGKFYTSYADSFLAPMYFYSDKIVPVHGGRGCPYRCNFCYHSSKARYRSIDVMIKEAFELLVRFDANMIEFNDDLVIATAKRADQLADGIIDLAKKLSRRIEYSISCRFNILERMDDELLLKLKRSGCRIMGIGLESGSQKILDVMNKKITVKQIVDGITRLKKAGIIPIAAIMIGQIDETEEDVLESLALLENLIKINPYFVCQFTITTPYPGSELYEVCFERGLIKSHEDFFNIYNPSIDLGKVNVGLSKMSNDVVEAHFTNFGKRYIDLKKQHLPRAYVFLEWLRGSLKRFEIRANAKAIRMGIPASSGILTICRRVFDGIQLFLDAVRRCMFNYMKV